MNPFEYLKARNFRAVHHSLFFCGSLFDAADLIHQRRGVACLSGNDLGIFVLALRKTCLATEAGEKVAQAGVQMEKLRSANLVLEVAVADRTFRSCIQVEEIWKG
jgi:hypothetical protein